MDLLDNFNCISMGCNCFLSFLFLFFVIVLHFSLSIGCTLIVVQLENIKKTVFHFVFLLFSKIICCWAIFYVFLSPLLSPPKKCPCPTIVVRACVSLMAHILSKIILAWIRLLYQWIKKLTVPLISPSGKSCQFSILNPQSSKCFERLSFRDFSFSVTHNLEKNTILVGKSAFCIVKWLQMVSKTILVSQLN
jgi:hypothetical protein